MVKSKTVQFRARGWHKIAEFKGDVPTDLFEVFWQACRRRYDNVRYVRGAEYVVIEVKG